MQKSHKKTIHIPLFIPHMGCPNQCVFCDQHTISGSCSFQTKEELLATSRRTIETHLTTIPTDAHCEIAFFGGSFTGIDRDLMVALLDLAQEYVNAGRAAGIRMSTRPDYITKEILAVLSRYTICAVELGIQSMDEHVLSRCKRGHGAADTRVACALLREAGFAWVGQMMVGLPGATVESEIHCAREICKMGAVGCRIYPTIVLHHTALADMTAVGTYKPLSVDEAAKRAGAVLEIFLTHGVPCLRIGLCDSEALHDPTSCMAGPVHPAMGELVGAQVYLERMEKALTLLLAENATPDMAACPQEVTVLVPTGDISMALGQKRKNKTYLEEKYPIKFRKFLEKPGLVRYNIEMTLHTAEQEA